MNILGNIRVHFILEGEDGKIQTNWKAGLIIGYHRWYGLSRPTTPLTYTIQTDDNTWEIGILPHNIVAANINEDE